MWKYTYELLSPPRPSSTVCIMRALSFTRFFSDTSWLRTWRPHSTFHIPHTPYPIPHTKRDGSCSEQDQKGGASIKINPLALILPLSAMSHTAFSYLFCQPQLRIYARSSASPPGLLNIANSAVLIHVRPSNKPSLHPLSPISSYPLPYPGIRKWEAIFFPKPFAGE